MEVYNRGQGGALETLARMQKGKARGTDGLRVDVYGSVWEKRGLVCCGV